MVTETQICPIHNTEMRQWSNERGTWWSHKTDGGKWCNGPSPKPETKPAQAQAPVQSNGFRNYDVERASIEGQKALAEGRMAAEFVLGRYLLANPPVQGGDWDSFANANAERLAKLTGWFARRYLGTIHGVAKDEEKPQ